jgi:cephalosporin hydroxylase
MKSIIERFRHTFGLAKQSKLVRDFNKLYYDGPAGRHLWESVSWLGVETLKCPLDLWIYQELIFQTKPEVIVETGVYAGGSTLYLASICDLVGTGRVLACDISLDPVTRRTREHPRVQLIEGSSVDPAIHSAIADQCRGRRTMVVLDSDHSCRHVLEELNLYAPLVTPGCYLICEDTNVNGHPVYADHGPGPFEAVKEFLRQNRAWSPDITCERLLVTFNPSGYLRRVGE